MTASKLSRMKVVGILRFGAILEVDTIPGGLDQSVPVALRALFLSYPSLG